MWWEIIYDVIYLFDVVAVLVSTIAGMANLSSTGID